MDLRLSDPTIAVPGSPLDSSTLDGARRAPRDGLEMLGEHALRQLLASQPVIEQAKGVLMGHYCIDADQAFAVLSRWSSHGNVKIRDLAAQLVGAASRPGPDPLPHLNLPDDAEGT